MLIENDYRGYDPFDILNAPLFRYFPKRGFPALVINKLGARYVPDSVRKMLRVPMIEDPKIYACAYFGYAMLEKEEFIAHRKEMISRLLRLAKRESSGISWGYQYHWQTRGDGTNKRGDSTMVPASFAMLALLYEFHVFGDETLRVPLENALSYYMANHLRQSASGKFLGYFARSKTNTHNANLLGCAAMSLISQKIGCDTWYVALAECAMTSIAEIDDTGYIPYSTHRTGQWTDCFHHLYVLAALYAIRQSNPFIDSQAVDEATGRMLKFYRKNFFTADGELCYYPNSIYPIDCHNYAAVILFHLLFPELVSDHPHVFELLDKVDRKTWERDRRRYVHRVHKNRTDARFFLRWNQAWMFTALCASSTQWKKNAFHRDRSDRSEIPNGDSVKFQTILQ